MRTLATMASLATIDPYRVGVLYWELERRQVDLIGIHWRTMTVV